MCFLVVCGGVGAEVIPALRRSPGFPLRSSCSRGRRFHGVFTFLSPNNNQRGTPFLQGDGLARHAGVESGTVAADGRSRSVVKGADALGERE